MATLLLPPGRTVETPTPVGTATLVVVLSPVRDALGHFRTVEQPIAAGQSVAAALVPHEDFQHIIWNGAALTPEQQAKVILAPGDEVTAFPAWGDPFTASLLITFAVGIAISVAMAGLQYLLFPPTKPHVEAPDPHTFSFEGIRTAIGPGNIKPVIYGRHRFGGQLLSASVDQALTVLDVGAGTTRVTALDTPPTLTMLVAMGEGPIHEILTNTIEMNGQPISNFPGVQIFTRRGTADQTPIVEFGETRNTFADGRELPDNSSNTGQEILYTTTEPVTAFVLNIVWNEGFFHMNGKGEKETNSVNIAYRWKVNGNPTWSAYSVFQVEAARTSPVRFGIRREGLALARYDIAVNFGGARHHDELRSHWQPTLESVTEIQAGAQAYPYTALLGLRAVATDQLQGALPNITAEVRGRTVRVNTFAPTESWSDNPAWCVLDIMTSQRYGMGILDSEIDLGAFQVWGDYCSETIGGELRHTFNYVLEREGRSQSLLMEMMGGSRTLMLYSEGFWSPRPTRNAAPGPLLSWATCSNLKVTYTRDPDRVNVMEARYANEEDAFQQDVLVWPTVENWPVEVRKSSLEIRTVTKPSRIMRALQFELNRRQYENMVIEFDNALDAVTMQVHDLFRFSHPMPGWGASGRVQAGSTASTIILDQDVSMATGVTYQLYIKHTTDLTESRIVFNPGDTTTHILQFGVPFTFTPAPDDALWAFGTASPDGAVRVFRATKVERKSDTTVHIQAVVHNPSIYDEPTAVPVPSPSQLPNPLGPPPGLTSLVATEVSRIQPSGASLRVVNLAWSIGGLGAGLAPYGGAKIFRRTVLLNSTAGLSGVGAIDLAAISDPNDANFNFALLTQVTGHTLEVDDFTVITGSTYLYRVIPVSGRGVPNVAGGREVLIHVSGPTTPDFFPGTPRNLRLLGKAVGVHTWEGRDVHLVWDTVSDNPLFSETFFVQDYNVQVWAPNQEYLMRSTTTGGVRAFTYTLSMNQEDQASNGFVGARRDLLFLVYAFSNTGRASLEPAILLVNNPPPDMSVIGPEVTTINGNAIIEWDQYVEPIDFDHYEVHLDITNPPVALYQDIATAFTGQGSSFRKIMATGLAIGATYYVLILPYDTFGPGIATIPVSFVAAGLTIDQIDTTPPATPTHLVLTTGSDIQEDGTVMAFVQATWDLAPESDVAGYEVHVFLGTSNVPTVWNPVRSQHSILFPVPGNTLVRVKLLAFDKFHNISPFSDEASITSAGDTVPPGPPLGLTAFGHVQGIHLLWTPPADGDYSYSEVWIATTNNRGVATHLATQTGFSGFEHTGLAANTTRYYWIRAVDTSGNISEFHPVSATAGVSGTAGELDDTYIHSLVADKISTGTIHAFVSIGVGAIDGNILLDGVNQQIHIADGNHQTRVLMGKLDTILNASWGLRLFNSTGALMWNFEDGAQTPGISNAAITSQKIAVAQIQAQHLVTNTAVITGAAQIENAIITDAKITNLAVNKILTGNVQVLWQIGVGADSHIQLDAFNTQINVWDDNRRRIVLGKLGSTATDWGLLIVDENGLPMWDLRGASTLGIHDAAITNAKIANAAITNAKIQDAAIDRAKIQDLEVVNAKIGNLQVGTSKVAANAITESILFAGSGGGGSASFETVYATITFAELDAGDQVWLVGNCTSTGAGQGGNTAYLVLREDNVSGTYHNLSSANGGSTASSTTPIMTLVVQGVYTSPSFQTGKTFVLATAGIHTISEVRFTALRRKK
jgi:predicted phage tail protein